jgi:hypothetical protein
MAAVLFIYLPGPSIDLSKHHIVTIEPGAETDSCPPGLYTLEHLVPIHLCAGSLFLADYLSGLYVFPMLTK